MLQSHHVLNQRDSAAMSHEESAMHRFNVAVLACILAASCVGLLPHQGGAQEATPATTPATKPQPPTQPTTGPGSSEVLFQGVTAIKQAPPGAFFADYWLFVPADPLPG